MSTKPTYYEFFAGGGMARAGLGSDWECVFANDFDRMKVATYTANWGLEHILCEDVAKVKASQLVGSVDLAWASFPCQDLSLAGGCLGLGSIEGEAMTRSGTFWSFWALMRSLKNEQRAPRMIVLENVYGTLTSKESKDFSAICSALSGADYYFGAIVVDAVKFVPQSRPRVFFIAVKAGSEIPSNIVTTRSVEEWHPRSLVNAYAKLSDSAKSKWLWWCPPLPPQRNTTLTDLIDDVPIGVSWHSQIETEKLVKMMTPLNKKKVTEAQLTGRKEVGSLYKRTRLDDFGIKRQRAEVRFDDIAGCLRTPSGGSSRQTILVIKGNDVRSRLLSPSEAARLMGLPDSYILPKRYNDAYHVAGDGVCVPVVRHLAKYILEPLQALKNEPKFLIPFG